MSDSHDIEYVGPEGEACTHLSIGNNRVECGYDCVKTYTHEKHVIVDKLEDVTCTSCRMSAEQDQRHMVS